VSDHHPHRTEVRPDPEELLRRYHLCEREGATGVPTATASQATQPQETRGQLRIYLGAAAGVGKTYAMLSEGRRRKQRGIDVVIGYVETHGRQETQAQLGDLEVLPRKQVPYRGVTLEEMETEALLARHPRLALIDELAHTNVAGSRHEKRYQDVQEVLDAGIDVLTALNVEHLETLHDLVASIIGREVRETVPDRLLEQADEVEVIDITPHALRQRIQEGYIYPPSSIEAALHRFFREETLTALRDLALRQVSELTEEQLRQYLIKPTTKPLWATKERVLVAFDQHLCSQHVIREAARLAYRLDADLLAAPMEKDLTASWIRRVMTFFKEGNGATTHQTEARHRLQESVRLAEDLGAEILQISSGESTRALLESARERHITRFVLGQPALSRWEVLPGGSVLLHMLRLNTEIDLHLVPVCQ